MTEKMTVKEFLEKNKLDFGQGFILIPPNGIYLEKRVYMYIIDDHYRPVLACSENILDPLFRAPYREDVEELLLSGFYAVRRKPWLEQYDIQLLLTSPHMDIVRGEDGKLFWSSGYALGDLIAEGLPNLSITEERWPVTDQGKEVNQELVFKDIRPGEFFNVDDLLSIYTLTADNRRLLKNKLKLEDEIIQKGAQ